VTAGLLNSRCNGLVAAEEKYLLAKSCIEFSFQKKYSSSVLSDNVTSSQDKRGKQSAHSPFAPDRLSFVPLGACMM